MRSIRIVIPALVGLSFGMSFLYGADKPAASAPSTPLAVKDAYPGLASGALMHARLAALPQGTLLKSEGLTLAEKDVGEKITAAPKEIHCLLYTSPSPRDS